MIGAIEVASRMGPDAVVVTVLPDSNRKYPSTHLLREESERPGCLTPRVELTSFRAIAAA